ncbi:MAG: transposase [Desulfosoma sp.]|uniref:transposase n=1 Tax=Desulfosoma sp. TaxID=2603217 RepID=UPI00404B97F9
MEGKPVKPVRRKRWPANRKRDLLLKVLQGQKTIVDAAREHDLKQSEIEQWMETLITCATEGLKAHPKSIEAIDQKELKQHQKKIGERGLQIDVLKKAERILSEGESLFFE